VTTEAVEELEKFRALIERACARSGRNARDVRLIGAAKTVEAERLRLWLQAGLSEVGENYVQEGVAKKAALCAEFPAVRWHLIGALQSNKASLAVREFDLIHSVDRLALAQALNKAAQAQNKVQDVLLQVNVGGEATKAGCAPDELETLAQEAKALPNLRVLGLMTLPPYDEDAEKTRPYFRQLRELRDDLIRKSLLAGGELSMGMSDDFPVAIEEGATIIRIGTALFGKRKRTM
jgi:PLP dependent protein